ncbi:Cj0069 family protein [Rhizobium leguminosarum]|uniref:Cj0069 family protein n=1 Tax=Rhizobium ruizarguesonis TaxID=2081791 RepID=UPI0004139834|nr:Cj0069 family protein [Rhizobium ruizarguesonis]MBY5847627.1 Cj0069 family protein [Rhizobium leguminosarum]NKL30840.1 Cj0069 family protein [Rhizobium leguminosarum bv. viciae]NEH88095.1 Cj0069 family protein [Rhizobium ruizarguesonis]NEI16636.1 Cj0069 family protein [Rhizobium ruizarguesonis]NEJ32470.1 Cj0069 family protein [Rhizobium ruizarguesonis]
MKNSPPQIAIVWRGDREARRAATPQNNRFHRIFEELAAVGLATEPAVFDEEFADEVLEQLLAVDAVLVWVNPLDDGKTRKILDPLLRQVAEAGRFVSAHPDVILKMGVKEVLYETRHIGWGVDTRLYRTAADFRQALDPTFLAAGPRVLKQNRGNGGQGIWKVEVVGARAGGATSISVLEAKSGSVPETIDLSDFICRCEAYFTEGGCIVDQPFQSRLPEGMIRCYMSGSRVVGFGQQLVKALVTPPSRPGREPLQPGPRIMHPAFAEPFHTLRTRMESEWTPQMMSTLGIEATSLPIIWDADFLYGPPDASGNDTYVLCEINVSSVFAIPDEAPAEIARAMASRLRGSAV